MSRIVVAVAVIGIVSYAATYAPLLINRDVGSEYLKEKVIELGSFLMEENPKVIYGLSTGSRTMTTAKIGENNVTILLGGDTLRWHIPKNAIFVRGIQFASPPESEVSSSAADTMLIYSTTDGFYAQPKVIVTKPIRTSDLSGTPLYVLSIRTCYLSDLRISGLFDLLKESAETSRHLYERSFLYDGTISVYVNGMNCMSFDIKKGEKLLVEFVHYNVKLQPLPRG